MCGIVAIVQRRPTRDVPDGSELRGRLDAAVAATARGPVAFAEAADALAAVDGALRGVPGVRALLADAALAEAVTDALDRVATDVEQVEQALDAGTTGLDAAAVESTNASIVAIRDAEWALRHDRLRTAAEVAALAGPDPTPSAVAAWTAVQLALSAVDRLEVRGRDSAGISVLVEEHGLDLDAPEIRSLIGTRDTDKRFTSSSVRTPDGHLGFVYKQAAEIGELGDNTRAIRQAVAGDELFALAVSAPDAVVTVVGHTRWASVGTISEPNAHPVNSEEREEAPTSGPYVVAALNGDVDNHAALVEQHGLAFPEAITTDAKVIPVLVSRRMARGDDVVEAFRTTVATFDGSVAIAAHAAAEPGRLALALRGSGQALYVGLADDAFVVASEPYGLVEVTPRYLRMDGDSGAVRGQVVVLDRAAAGEVAGITRVAYDGTPLPVDDDEITTAQITTRDIDRAGFRHFLLKELTESPSSLRKTLRGRIVERDGLLEVALPEESLPADVRDRLRDGGIRRVTVIGQGTAAVAAQSVAASLRTALVGSSITAEAVVATELSGFQLHDDMSDTLAVAVSQSGTTADTNRAVDLLRGRGAAIVAIVNRRNSDLVDRVHGVVYTSDGRDVEMAVPSTKAFYAQVAAGVLLARAVARAAGCRDRVREDALLRALRGLPDAMREALAQRPVVTDIARRLAPSRRHWAVVGNGANLVAAEECRIKISELCYKSIACDVTEDKKHIDLSSEPLILVCAAGLDPAHADDVAKEIAIFSAHKAAPVVVATSGEHRLQTAGDRIEVPATDPELAFVLSTVAGHLFGYEAALAIDAGAQELREVRATVDALPADGAARDEVLSHLADALRVPAGRVVDAVTAGAWDGVLEASTALRLVELLRIAVGALPFDVFRPAGTRLATPDAFVEALSAALGKGIDELTRPVDAIKHQAKTVTVGTSRSEEELFARPLVAAVLDAGGRRDRLGYRSIRTLHALEPAVASVTGFTRYAVDGDPAGEATVRVLAKGGVAESLRSRAETDPVLRGTKHRAASLRQVVVSRGHDGRVVVIVPEQDGPELSGLVLLHADFRDLLPAGEASAVLRGYLDRYEALVDAVTETEPAFDDAVLGTVPIVDLLTQPVHVLAAHWKTARS